MPDHYGRSTCPRCHGRGRVGRWSYTRVSIHLTDCTLCRGTGWFETGGEG